MRILIAETSWTSMAAAKDLASAGFLLSRANDGHELFEYADLSEQNLILFDADLPDMSALDCLRRLRAAKPDAAICVMADAKDMTFCLRAFELGADDVIGRKTDRAELIARVQAVARRRAGHSTPVIEIADLTVDCLRRRAMIAGRELPLTRLEYELLELLALRQGQIVDKDTIMAQLYALGDAPDSKIIGVYVHHIRAKIAASGGDMAAIENIRGRGYALVDVAHISMAA